jgi:hypothetical protein
MRPVGFVAWLEQIGAVKDGTSVRLLWVAYLLGWDHTRVRDALNDNHADRAVLERIAHAQDSRAGMSVLAPVRLAQTEVQGFSRE